jgi:hypothetical protein
MDIAVVTELIGSFGFPIALVVAMGWFILKIYNQSVAREEKLMAEIAENRIVNEKAIGTLAVYAERLGSIESDVKEIKHIITSE